jgi:predicted ferric reductase
VIHVALSADWSKANPFTPSKTPARVWFGGVAAAALVVLVASSVWRHQLRLSYEVWQVLHAVLAVIAVVAALVHVLLVDYYVDSAWKQVLWSIMTAAFVWLLVWVRLLRPLRIRRRPWTVERITSERDSTTVLTLRPAGHDGLRFEPGQFAWITVGRSPFSVTSHPFSFCSSAETNGSVEVAVKAAGDFTSSVATVEPGTEVYLDGPHGVFSIDQYEGAGFCLIAGGVGIAPALSMLETLADRGDVRPVVLFAGNREWDSIILRERIDELTTRLNVQVVHVLEQPPPDWPGRRGISTRTSSPATCPQVSGGSSSSRAAPPRCSPLWRPRSSESARRRTASIPNASTGSEQAAHEGEAVRHIYLTRIAIATTVLLVLACLAFAAIQN